MFVQIVSSLACQHRNEKSLGISFDQNHTSREEQLPAVDIDVPFQIGDVFFGEIEFRRRHALGGIAVGIEAQDNEVADRRYARNVR